jgi:acyl phosphate:glycerol-3-phosphate acyltransferase
VDILVGLIIAAVAYLLGSIPTGYLVGMAKGVDVRKIGSGNIGATNVFRILGKWAGILVLVVDGLKGWASVAIVPEFIYRLCFATALNDTDQAADYLRIIAGIVVILGHNYTCWLSFKGGKGIATSAGVLAALIPWTFMIGFVTWVVVCLLTRYVSLASIAAAVSLPLGTLAVRFLGVPYSYRMVIITVLMSTLAIYKHKANIVRLMNGTESKLGQKRTPPATGATS